MSDLTLKQKVGYFSRLARARRERYYISLNCKGSWNPDTKKRIRYAWPILFMTRQQAEQAMRVLPIFANAEAIPGRGRIVSASVECVVLSQKPSARMRRRMAA